MTDPTNPCLLYTSPDIELPAFEEKVCCLVQNQMLVNIIDRALLRLKRYPDRGELYYEILTKQFIYRFKMCIRDSPGGAVRLSILGSVQSERPCLCPLLLWRN